MARVRAACARLPAPTRPDEIPVRARAAAVLLAIFEEDGEARLILTKRPASMPSHQGEIAFPGGKFEPGVDADLAATARREADEEVGLDPGSIEIVGELDTLVTVAGRFLLTPFVGLVPTRPVLRPDPSEVDVVFDVALRELLADGVHHEEVWDRPGDVAGERTIQFFDLETETVWGATARVLVGFLEALTATPSGP